MYIDPATAPLGSNSIDIQVCDSRFATCDLQRASRRRSVLAKPLPWGSDVIPIPGPSSIRTIGDQRRSSWSTWDLHRVPTRCGWLRGWRIPDERGGIRVDRAPNIDKIYMNELKRPASRFEDAMA